MLLAQLLRILTGTLIAISFFVVPQNTYAEESSNLPEKRPLEISLSRITKISSIELDSDLLSNAKLLALASWSTSGMFPDTSSIQLFGGFVLPELDSLIVMQFCYGGGFFQGVIYDPRTDFITTSDFDLSWFNYLILKHKGNPKYSDALFLTRLAFILCYGFPNVKNLPDDPDSLFGFIYYAKDTLWLGQIRRAMTGCDRVEDTQDLFSPITNVQCCIHLCDNDEDVYRINASFRHGLIKEYEVQIVKY